MTDLEFREILKKLVDHSGNALYRLEGLVNSSAGSAFLSKTQKDKDAYMRCAHKYAKKYEEHERFHNHLEEVYTSLKLDMAMNEGYEYDGN